MKEELICRIRECSEGERRESKSFRVRNEYGKDDLIMEKNYNNPLT